MVNSSNNNRFENLTLGLPVRDLFPFFKGPYAKKASAYLDTAASALKPTPVIERLTSYLSFEHANIHRGAYELSAHSTVLYNDARATVARYINSKSSQEVVFTRGATEALNLLAYSYGSLLAKDQGLLVSLLEHHSNFVPWQMLAERRQLKLDFIGLTNSASIDIEDYKLKLEKYRPALVALTAHSNSFGTVSDSRELIKLAHDYGAKVVLDATQAVVHGGIDVQHLDADFVVFSGHKLYGPTGIGCLWARQELLAQMPPFHGGGDMIRQVATEGSSWAEAPQKFEAGTPPIAEAIGLGTAIELMEGIGRKKINDHESALYQFAWELLSNLDGVSLFGSRENGSSILAFSVDKVHPHDLASISDQFGVQIRAGHHCTMPALRALGLQSTARASIGIYSDKGDFEALASAISEARRIFS